MKYLIILLLLTTCNQTYERSVKVCNCEERKEVKEFIQNSIKNSNNMSDEEMEDVIKQLQITAITTICSETMGTFTNNTFDYNSVKHDSCLIYHPYNW